METVWIRDPGCKKVGSGIRDKHPGSATLARVIILLPSWIWIQQLKLLRIRTQIRILNPGSNVLSER
jgi:hypothetical protein